MKTYLIHTKFNTYRYQRRVPKALAKYIDKTFFKISLGTDLSKATIAAIQFNKAIEDAISLISLVDIPELIFQKLACLIPQEKSITTAQNIQTPGLFKTLTKEYLDTKKGNVTELEHNNNKYFFSIICPPIFQKIMGESNPNISDISYSQLIQFKNILQQLPKRNIHKYRVMEMNDILTNLNHIPAHNLLKPTTINKRIKMLRGLFQFALIRGLLSVNLAQSITTLKTIDERHQRLPLSIQEIDIINIKLSKEKQYLFNVLRYSGMRLSELYKCKIEMIKGISCFSLLDRNIRLKTKGSYRIIPIHSSIMGNISNFYHYRKIISHANLGASVSKIIKKEGFTDSHKKSLHSVRHSFANKLIQTDIDSNIVSELLGHSHSGNMTLSRYVKGYTPEQLKKVIELL